MSSVSSPLRREGKRSEHLFLPKTVWACSSVGRALRSQRRGHGFESHQVHQKNCAASVACRAPHRDGALGLLRHVGEIRRRSSVGQSVRFTSVRSRVRAPSSPPKKKGLSQKLKIKRMAQPFAMQFCTFRSKYGKIKEKYAKSYATAVIGIAAALFLCP